MPNKAELTVWAPRVDTLELVEGDGERHAFVRGDRGRFTGEVSLPPGARYGFLVDGNGPFPDPRSEYLPDGVHRLSQRWDQHYRFRHDDFRPVPFAEAVLYELHIGTFSQEGTFLGAISHLDHLVDLGVTHIELMPLFAFPGRQGWGYDGVALFAPHAPYGTPDDLKKLVDEAHGRGLAVILDIVFNHLGPDGNYLGLYGPYFTDRYRTPWGEAVNLDGPDSDLVRRTFVECALYWLDNFRFDGLRLDAVHALHDQSAVHFLEELARRVDELERASGRTLTLIAECDLNDPKYVRPVSAGGFGLDAQWCDDFHHAIHSFLTGERDGYYEDYGGLHLVAKALTQGYVFDGTWSPHRRRHHGRPPEGVGPDQLVVFAQNHDQIGNRARGERLSHLLPEAKQFQAAALTLLSPFVPLLFQGEEWGATQPFLYFTDHQDAQLARNVTEGRTKEFGAFSAHHGEVPDPQAEATFLASVLDWNATQTQTGSKALEWYRTLLCIRREHALGATPRRPASVRYEEEEGWLVLERGDVAAFFNFSSRSRTPPGYGEFSTILARYPEGDGLPGELPPDSTVIAMRSIAPT